MYIYKFSRYFCFDEREHKTLKAAVQDAWWDNEHGDAYPLQVVNEKGSVILSNDELFKEIEKLNE